MNQGTKKRPFKRIGISFLFPGLKFKKKHKQLNYFSCSPIQAQKNWFNLLYVVQPRKAIHYICPGLKKMYSKKQLLN